MILFAAISLSTLGATPAQYALQSCSVAPYTSSNLVPFESPHRLVEKVRTGDELEIRMDELVLINKTQNTRHELKPLGDVLPIIEAGGVFAYAKQTGMLK